MKYANPIANVSKQFLTFIFTDSYLYNVQTHSTDSNRLFDAAHLSFSVASEKLSDTK